MRALITGGAGFIGSHLAEYLLAAGHEVTVIDDLSTGTLANVAHMQTHPRFQLAIADITHEPVMDRLVSACDVVFHMAAAVGVQLIVERPIHTIHTNVHGTEQVLRLAARYRRKVLVASTSEVYGKATPPFREDDDLLLGPTIKSRWSYAASKAIDEFLALAYHQEMGLEVVIFRLFNTVGPRQTGQYGMVVPRLVRQALEGAPLTVYGDGQQTRCFCDVSDVVRAIVGLADAPAALGQVFNIGSSESVTMRQLAERIVVQTGSASPIVHIPYDEAYRPGFEDMRHRAPDTSKIRSCLGWAPTLSLDDILRRVADDQRARLGGGTPDA